MDPTIKSRLLYQLSYSPLVELPKYALSSKGIWCCLEPAATFLTRMSCWGDADVQLTGQSGTQHAGGAGAPTAAWAAGTLQYYGNFGTTGIGPGSGSIVMLVTGFELGEIQHIADRSGRKWR